MRFTPLRGLLLSCLSAVALADVFDLSELHWTLKNQNGSIVIPGSVPSQAHLDLLKAGIITEPLLGTNDNNERWVVNDNWTYTADISSLLHNSSQQSLLVFYGIDTIATITLAGHPLAWVNNQFRQYVFDVSDILSSSALDDKNLTVAFESAWFYGLNVTNRPDAEFFPNGGDFPTSDNFEYPGVRQWIRKVASDFGWDWGPAFVPSGIYKPAFLVTLSNSAIINNATSSNGSATGSEAELFIEESSIDIFKRGQTSIIAPNQEADWIVNVTLVLRSAVPLHSPSITLSIPELQLTSSALKIPSIPGTVNTSTWVSVDWSIPEGVPQRWFPHNLGKPQLYNLTVAINPSSSTSRSPLTSLTVRTGFRTIQLVQTPYSQEDVQRRGITPGDQWHFEINGKAFYSSGTNIIPFDPFYARTTTDQVRWVLESAVLSGQNMVRIWGGGTYQPSSADVAGGVYDFYSICDELGILAWSELIFSDTLYPINDFLLETIEPEVRQNVRRVNQHPSLAQWAGGNEIEGIVAAANLTFANGTHYLNEYVTLFQHFLHDIVLSETNSVPYTDCSTTKGVLSLDPYVLRFNNGTPGHIYGNGERYNYDASQAFNYSTYPSSRFMNEFGFHSMPSFYSWEEVLTSPEDFSFNSTVVASRDHHPPAGNLSFPNPNAPQGQFQMSSAVELWLPTPSTTNSNQTFAQWCWSTQIFQSMAMVAQLAWYRRGAGRGENNLGALVWQLNDIWQGVSWSSIEYSGRWKLLHYGETGAFAPVAIYPFWTAENESLEVEVTSDRWETVHGQAQLTWYDWHGKTLQSTKHSFSVPTLNNSLIFNASGLDAILPKGTTARNVWMLANSTAVIDGKTVVSEQYFTPISLADAALVDPKIHVTRGHNFTFTLSAQGGVAPWTWIDHPAGTVGFFSDTKTGAPSNGFYLVPGIDRTVSFILNTAISKVVNPDPEDFVVRSLWNNTHV